MKVMDLRMMQVFVFLLALAGGLLYIRLSKGLVSYHSVGQPVDFNHYLHVHEKELSCEDCHSSVKTGYFATIPTTETCETCHSEPQGSSAREKAFVEQYAGTGRPISWQRLFVLPEHVFFSHRIHVVRAQIACPACHGSMEMQKRPPEYPLKVLTMDNCMDCHRQRKAVLDCNGCHR